MEGLLYFICACYRLNVIYYKSNQIGSCYFALEVNKINFLISGKQSLSYLAFGFGELSFIVSYTGVNTTLACFIPVQYPPWTEASSEHNSFTLCERYQTLLEMSYNLRYIHT